MQKANRIPGKAINRARRPQKYIYRKKTEKYMIMRMSQQTYTHSFWYNESIITRTEFNIEYTSTKK